MHIFKSSIPKNLQLRKRARQSFHFPKNYRHHKNYYFLLKICRNLPLNVKKLKQSYAICNTRLSLLLFCCYSPLLNFYIFFNIFHIYLLYILYASVFFVPRQCWLWLTFLAVFVVCFFKLWPIIFNKSLNFHHVL